MVGTASWRAFLARNTANATRVVRGFTSTRVGGSYARFMAVGAGLGAIRGLADNVVGEDRVSVMGGMMQGAMIGAGVRGIGSLWGMKNRLGSLSRRSARRPSPLMLSDMRGRPIPGKGFTMSGSRP